MQRSARLSSAPSSFVCTLPLVLPAKTRFDQLKQQVRDIKNEHREVHQAKVSEREVRISKSTAAGKHSVSWFTQVRYALQPD